MHKAPVFKLLKHQRLFPDFEWQFHTLLPAVFANAELFLHFVFFFLSEVLCLWIHTHMERARSLKKPLSLKEIQPFRWFKYTSTRSLKDLYSSNLIHIIFKKPSALKALSGGLKNRTFLTTTSLNNQVTTQWKPGSDVVNLSMDL